MNIEYDGYTPSREIISLTLQPVLKDDGTIQQINHTGSYYDEGKKLVPFKGIRTLFNYEEIRK